MKGLWLNEFIDNTINKTVSIYGATKLHLYEAYLQQREQLIGNDGAITLLLSTVVALNPKILYKLFIKITFNALEHLVYATLVYLLVCLFIYVIISRTKVNTISRLCLPWPVKKKKRVLIVIAHPDDECMFFGPLIYSLINFTNSEVYLLCLTNGNYENLCHLRRAELWSACMTLGIPDVNIMLVNATNLPDDPNVEWKIETVAKLVLHSVESLSIQAIVTFDRDGVTQHPNHCAVYYAVASLCLANLLPKDCKLYALDSINIVRKYLSIFDIVCTCLMSRHWCIMNWSQAAFIRTAMQKHESQMKWFRWLYIYFSRYIFINTIREVNLDDVELEMQIEDC